MAKKICYMDANGVLKIVIPIEPMLESENENQYLKRIQDRAEAVDSGLKKATFIGHVEELPKDRKYRDAWKLEHGVLVEDAVKKQEIDAKLKAIEGKLSENIRT